MNKERRTLNLQAIEYDDRDLLDEIRVLKIRLLKFYNEVIDDLVDLCLKHPEYKEQFFKEEIETLRKILNEQSN